MCIELQFFFFNWPKIHWIILKFRTTKDSIFVRKPLYSSIARGVTHFLLPLLAPWFMVSY